MKTGHGLPMVACAALCVSTAALAQPARRPVAPKIDSVTARLFYETTGEFSRDIFGAPPFRGLNTTRGEGDAEQPANDILVSIAMSVPAEKANVEQFLVVRITGDRGRVLSQRVFRSHAFKDKGRLVKAIWVSDATCSGDFRVEAAIGASKVAKRVTLRCAE